MQPPELFEAVRRANLAVLHAQGVREAHRKRTPRSNVQRGRDIQMALNRIRDEMTPVRAELARIPYLLRRDLDDGARQNLESQREILLKVSDMLQRERRKLWKMQERKSKKKGRKT